MFRIYLTLIHPIGLVINYTVTPSDSQSSPEINLYLQAHLGCCETHGPPQGNATPAVLPLMLQVRAITIYSIDPTPNEPPALCNESAWTCFVETALKFQRLQHVELFWEWDSASSDHFRDPVYMDITDTAFKPLFEAGKFSFRLLDSDWNVVLTATSTVNPKHPDKQADKAVGRSGVRDGDPSSSPAGTTEEMAGSSPGDDCCYSFRLQACTHAYSVEPLTTPPAEENVRQDPAH